jgi:nitrogen regulatory protein PII
MKQLVVIVKPFRAEAVLQAADEFGVSACVVREAKGYGRQKNYLDRYVGSDYDFMYLPKVEISMWVRDEQLDEAARRVAQVARTGRIGDGKILVLDVAYPDPLEF